VVYSTRKQRGLKTRYRAFKRSSMLRHVAIALVLLAILSHSYRGEALSLPCIQKLTAVQPCLKTPSGSACCEPAKVANDAKCLCDPDIFQTAQDFGVEIDGSNITQIAINCGFPLASVALAGSSNCPYGKPQVLSDRSF
jgi:hypothetical protein